MRHLLTTKDFNDSEIEALLHRADFFLKNDTFETAKKNKLIINIFFENPPEPEVLLRLQQKGWGLMS